MPWFRIEMKVETPFAEAFSDALIDLGAQSVTIEDAWADTPSESPCYGEPGFEVAASWRDTRLCALVDMRSDAGALTRAAALAVGLHAAPAYGVTLVEDDDWVRRTQSQFSPTKIGRRLWIVPSWCEPPAHEDALVVRLDPGLAFGTGSHATTRLMLTWLEATLAAEGPGSAHAARRVLDYGCGSGILALAAVKLGASEVVAIDLDPGALEACARNAVANGASIRIEPPERLPAGSYDLLLSNILAQPLIDLVPVFAAHAVPGAQIALSGVLTEQAGDVVTAYAAEFEMRVEAVAEGWALLAGARR